MLLRAAGTEPGVPGLNPHRPQLPVHLSYIFHTRTKTLPLTFEPLIRTQHHTVTHILKALVRQESITTNPFPFSEDGFTAVSHYLEVHEMSVITCSSLS